MPQGAFKSRKTVANELPSGSKKSQKNNPKIKKNKISAKKSKIVESKKLKKNLEKAINIRIEEDVKALASNEATPFKILKSSTGETRKRKYK